jgi:ABC-type nitrate/sulfonate/bicarbonate transport system substrate-binding protein
MVFSKVRAPLVVFGLQFTTRRARHDDFRSDEPTTGTAAHAMQEATEALQKTAQALQEAAQALQEAAEAAQALQKATQALQEGSQACAHQEKGACQKKA